VIASINNHPHLLSIQGRLLALELCEILFV
jgi:hypothetical protein